MAGCGVHVSQSTGRFNFQILDMKAKRLLYLFYYLRKLDRKKLRGFLTYASRESGRSRISLLLASVFCVFRYNTSILDYFFFRFYEKNREERLKWAGTGFMYEYQKRMNPMGAREVLENKILFSQRRGACSRIKLYPELIT